MLHRVYGTSKRSPNNLTNVNKTKQELCVCVFFLEVYENGEDENPILNLGELQHFTDCTALCRDKQKSHFITP